MNASHSDGVGQSLLEPTAGNGTDSRTILLLDPVTLFLRLQETILRRQSWTLHRARTAEDALATLEDEHVDLLIMEQALPDTTGAELIRAIRANPRTRATGILVVTARGAGRAADACLEAGANGVLFKPVTRAELCARAEELLYVAARRHVRALVCMKVLAQRGQASTLGNTVNVSAGGMLLETAAELCTGDVLELRFSLPGDAAPLAVRGRVVRQTRTDRPGLHAAGLVFEGMSDDERARVDAFVAASRRSSVSLEA